MSKPCGRPAGVPPTRWSRPRGARARGLIVERDAEYDFAHERLRTLVEERAGLARRRLLHARVAEVLAVGRGDPALIARHLELAGRAAEAAEAYLAAGDRARDLAATAEALDHYRTALALGHPGRPACTRPWATCTRCAASTVRRWRPTKRRRRWPSPIAWRGSSTSSARCMSAAASGNWPSATTGGAASGSAARVQADRSLVARRRGDDGERCDWERGAALAEPRATSRHAQAHNMLGLLGAAGSISS